MAAFDMGFGNLPNNASSVFDSEVMDGDEYVRCACCGFGGCDVRVSICGCTMHARCTQLNLQGALTNCPNCGKATDGLVLFPMSFREIDEAHRAASSNSSSKGRGRKRKSMSGSEGVEEKASYISERRTGRWTTEEMAYCDRLMDKFETGELPVADGIKLNEFLGNMLKSKQSRLTKKMKNAKLSSKSFQRSTGCLNRTEARQFSESEEFFFYSITDMHERAEIKFHMQREWREQFSRVCASIGQPLDAENWLHSVEEMDRRASQAKDAARMAKRKKMMGVALRTDTQNPDMGVFIEKTESEVRAAYGDGSDENIEDEVLNILAEDKSTGAYLDFNGRSSHLHAAPFLAKTILYMQRHNIPFEHVDLWVPSFVPGDNDTESNSSCRLCFAGSSTIDKLMESDGKYSRDISGDEKFNLNAFGDYSQKFSFDVGCGLPGRVYESGRASWEQNVQDAPHHHFERCGGATQWGIKTVVGIPIASPNVGRIVVTLYSLFDRVKDEDVVSRLSEEFTRLMPSPKWKLVVDIGEVDEAIPSANQAIANASVNVPSNVGAHHAYNDSINDAFCPLDFNVPSVSIVNNQPIENNNNNNNTIVSSEHSRDSRTDAVVSLLGEYMPSDLNSASAPFMQGFVSLRLLLLKSNLTSEEREITRTLLDSYTSYSAGGRQRNEIAILLARDYMYLNKSNQPQSQYQVGGQQSQHAHHPQQQQQQQHHMQHHQQLQQHGHNPQNNLHNMQQQQQQQQQQQMPFLGLGPSMLSNVAFSQPGGMPYFRLPSTSSSLQNSPALAPIPVMGTNNDCMSVISK